MSQPSEVASNGPSQHATLKQEFQEAVKVVPGNGNPTPVQPFIPTVGQQQQSGDQNRPVLRRVDSRGAFPQPQYRPQGPYPNQPPQQVQQGPPVQGSVIRASQPRPQPPPGTHFNPRPPLNQQPRFPNQLPPQRYAPPDNLIQNNQNPDLYRRPVTLPEGQTTQRPPTPHRPPIPAPIQTNPRPTVTPQRSYSGSGPQSPLQGSFDQGYKKFNLDSTENLSHDEQNGSKEKPNISQIKNQSFSQSKNNDLNSSTEKLYREDYRSSSSLGFVQDPEKDIDTSALNGKTSSHEDIVERPESRASLIKEQPIHSSMHKIDEDDDDSVITPSRVNSARSITGSTDNISQKSVDLNDQIKQTKPEIKQPYIYNPEIKQTPAYMPETKPIPPKPQETQPQLKYPTITKSNVMPEMKQHAYPQPVPYTPENTQKESSDTYKYTKPYTSETDYKPYSNEDVVVAPMRTITPEPPRMIPPQKPTNLQNTIKKPMEKQYQPPNDTWTNKEKIKTPDGKNNLLSPTSPATPRVNKVDKRVLSPRTEMSINNYLNRRGTSAKSQRSEGDNDSGVDESTQGNEQSCNGENSSPKKSQKSSQKPPSATKCKTPVKSLQSPKSPETANTIPSSTEKKKVPMNKVHVGSAPSPNLKTVKSKIGSLDNTTHRPGGGHIKIENKKLDFAKVSPRIAAKNDAYMPTGGDKKIPQQKLQWNAKSKIGSLENADYKPKNSAKKIETVKLDFKEKAKSKVGSKDNIKHQPGGGDIKIDNRKLDIKAQSKIGSLDNVKHKPGGGDVKIFDDKEYLKQRAASSAAEHNALSGSQEPDTEEINYSQIYDNEPLSLNISAPKRRVRYLDLEGPHSLDVHHSSHFENRRPASACGGYNRRKFKVRPTIPIEERPRWRY